MAYQVLTTDDQMLILCLSYTYYYYCYDHFDKTFSISTHCERLSVIDSTAYGTQNLTFQSILQLSICKKQSYSITTTVFLTM